MWQHTSTEFPKLRHARAQNFSYSNMWVCALMVYTNKGVLALEKYGASRALRMDSAAMPIQLARLVAADREERSTITESILAV